MKISVSILLVALLGVGGTLTAEMSDKPPSAFASLKQARRLLGEKGSGAHFLSMESENAKLRPRYWWIRFYDDSLLLKLRAVQMIGPEMIRNLEPGNPFDGGNKAYVIDPESLKIDSDRCIAIMEELARDNKIPLAGINARLRKPHPGESNPVWYFEWLDANNDTLGKVNISATTGRVLEIVGLKLKSKRHQDVSRKTAAQETEDTFLGIGGDLEEFFTGARTVDQEEDLARDKN